MEFSSIITLLFIFLGLLVLQVRAEQRWRQVNHGNSVININEKDHYYLFGIYANVADKRIIVSKRSGGGYTFNFGNPVGLILFVIIAAAAIYLII